MVATQTRVPLLELWTVDNGVFVAPRIDDDMRFALVGRGKGIREVSVVCQIRTFPKHLPWPKKDCSVDLCVDGCWWRYRVDRIDTLRDGGSRRLQLEDGFQPGIVDPGRDDAWQHMVGDFHRKFGQPIAEEPIVPLPDRVALRRELIKEEVNELDRALALGDMVEIADGLADAIYVLLGTAIEYGIDLAPIFAEVHHTNMAKENGGTRADGKILKPEGWKAPDIARLLKAQGWEAGDGE